MGSRWGSRLGIALALMVLAGTLHFYKLGEWSFAGDETSTLAEERLFFAPGEASASPASQASRLPRVIPLSYLIHHLSATWFGRDEFGSRVLMAILGTAFVGLVFGMLDVLQGRTTALATALLVTFWPEHLFQSQQTRFYIVAAFFAALSLLVGAFLAKRRSVAWGVAWGGTLLAAILCHTLLGTLLLIVAAGVLAGTLAERRPIPPRLLLVFAGIVLTIGLFFLVYLRPLLRGWNADASWAYGSVHAALASVNMVGWPVALLAALGFLVLLLDRKAENWYWNTCALGFAAATLAFPFFVAYHPEYVFPLALSVFVLAGSAIGAIYDGLRNRSRLVAMAWVGLACLGNVPSVASHYRDGSRPDFRTAAQYVKEHWQDGDRVTAFSMGLLHHYAEQCKPAFPLPASTACKTLGELTDSPARLWVVVQSGRSGLPEELRRWLGTHCSHEITVRRTRFDYADNAVDVFLYAPANPAPVQKLGPTRD